MGTIGQSATALLLRLLLCAAATALLSHAQPTLPDLSPHFRSHDGTAVVGHIFDAVVIVDNFGAGFSGSYHIGVYLSQDALFGPGDTLLASTDHQGLAAYKDLFWGIQGRIPDDILSGIYYLLIVADSANQIVESDESNNTFAAPILIEAQPLPDLRPASVSTSPTVQGGSAVPYEVSIANEGGSSHYIFEAGLYISKDPTITTADIPVHRRVALEVPYRQVRRVSSSWLVPDNLASGTYYFGVVLDDTNQVPEAIESNNSMGFGPISIDNPPRLATSLTSIFIHGVEGKTSHVSRVLEVWNGGTGQLDFELTTDQPWLTVDPQSGTSAGEKRQITISVNFTAAAVERVGTIRAQTTDGKQFKDMTITALLGTSPKIGFAPSAIRMSARKPTRFVTETLSISNTGTGDLEFEATPTVPWLKVPSGTGVSVRRPVPVLVEAQIESLEAGVHSGAVVVTRTSVDDPSLYAVTVPVEVEVLALPAILLSREAIQFNVPVGGAPELAMLHINTDVATVPFYIEVAKPWISIDPAPDTLSPQGQDVVITVDPAGLAAGRYSDVVRFLPVEPGAATPAALRVDLNVGTNKVPVLGESPMLNAASFATDGMPGHAVAAGAIVSIFGLNFSNTIAAAATVPLPTELNGLTVKLNGIPAPLFFVSPEQVNAQLPFGVEAGPAVVVVEREGFESEERTVDLAAASPAIFTLAATGSGQGIVLHANSAELAAPTGIGVRGRPARAGDILTILATGLGAVVPAISEGLNSCDPDGVCAPDFSNLILRETVARPVISIGGVLIPDDDVLFSGLAPEFVGVYQISFRLAAGVAPGDAVPVILGIDGIESRGDVTIAVQ